MAKHLLDNLVLMEAEEEVEGKKTVTPSETCWQLRVEWRDKKMTVGLQVRIDKTRVCQLCNN